MKEDSKAPFVPAFARDSGGFFAEFGDGKKTVLLSLLSLAGEYHFTVP